MNKNQSNVIKNAAEQLHEALRERGFLTRVDGDRVVLSGGNGNRDFADVRRLLEAEGVPACYSGVSIQVLCPSLPRSILLELSHMPVRYGRAELPHGFHGWKAFTKRGHGVKWNTLSLDRGIAYLVKGLSEAGVLATGGCDGHGRAEPRVYLAGDYAAAWLELNLPALTEGLKLHYRWEVTPGSDNASPRLQAVRGEEAPWSRRKIREDALMIGGRLREKAEELRAVRRRTFKHRSMKQDAEQAAAAGFTELCAWMSTILNKGADRV